MMNKPSTKANGPDPEVMEAVDRLKRVELSPLEEQLFTGWMAANGIDQEATPDNPVDFRKIYQKTKGKVMPPGQLLNETEKQSAIEAIMKAQEAHDASSPIQALMSEWDGDMGGGSGSPMMGGGGDEGF